jgi:sugar lactone lactonase YvrE
MPLTKLIFSIILTTLSLTAVSQKSASELYKPKVITPVNSSTIGIEGPAADKHGNVYYVNYSHQGTIGMLSSEGESSVFTELPEGSIGNGIRFNSNGDMLIADYTGHNILKVDMKNRKITVFAHEPQMSQPNDIAIDSKDRLYASDPNWKAGTGRIWRIDTDGSVTLLESLGLVNGIEVSPDDKTLYVNSVRKILAYDLSQDGNISNKRVLIEFPDFGMDGMRCDIKGNLHVTRFGVGAIATVTPAGKLIREVSLIGKKPTNIAFGGKDGRTVYVTLQDKGNLESYRTDIPGREWKMQK